jgi:hypothetical protein
MGNTQAKIDELSVPNLTFDACSTNSDTNFQQKLLSQVIFQLHEPNSQKYQFLHKQPKT